MKQTFYDSIRISDSLIVEEEAKTVHILQEAYRRWKEERDKAWVKFFKEHR